MFKAPQKRKRVVVKRIDKEPKKRKIDEVEQQLKVFTLELKQAVQQNTFKRTKHFGDSEKFQQSDNQVLSSVRKLFLLPTRPDVYYIFITEWGGIPLLLNLITHESTNIVQCVVELISELCDSDLVNIREDFIFIFEELQRSNILEILSSHVKKWDITNQSICQTMMNVLKIVENFVQVLPESKDIIVEKTVLFHFILRYNQLLHSENLYPPLYHYTCELMCMFLVEDKKFKFFFVEKNRNNFEKLLNAIFLYIEKPPKSAEEEESFENLMNCVCSLNLDDDVKLVFGEISGIQFLLKLIKEAKYSRSSAIKALDYALLNCVKNCEILVENKGLKLYFALFKRMKTRNEEHLISMLLSMVKQLPEKKIQKRVMNKFREKQFEKTKVLFPLFKKYDAKMQDFDRRLQNGDLEEEFKNSDAVTFGEEIDDWLFLEKMDQGYLIIQQLCIILCYISKDETVKKTILEWLKNQNIEVQRVSVYVDEYSSTINDIDEHKWLEEIKKNLVTN